MIVMLIWWNLGLIVAGLIVIDKHCGVGVVPKMAPPSLPRRFNIKEGERKRETLRERERERERERD